MEKIETKSRLEYDKDIWDKLKKRVREDDIYKDGTHLQTYILYTFNIEKVNKSKR